MTKEEATPLQTLVSRTRALVQSGLGEAELTKATAEELQTALAAGLDVPLAAQAGDPDHYVMYPLHVEPDGSFSIASAVWGVGQETPVHGHETWGVVGIYSGHEHEVGYHKPDMPDVPLVEKSDDIWGPGQVTVCCTTNDDVHRVRCHGDSPVVGINIYGADIGTLRRRTYEPESGRVDWFVSTWAEFS